MHRPAIRRFAVKTMRPPAAKTLRIYLIDDDAPFRESLRILLELRGYGVEEFSDGEDFFAGAVLSDHSCVVSDVNLPGIGGLGILVRVRSAGAPVPVILISGRPTRDMREHAMATGAAAFFEKPVPTAALFSLLDDFEVAAH